MTPKADHSMTHWLGVNGGPGCETVHLECALRLLAEARNEIASLQAQLERARDGTALGDALMDLERLRTERRPPEIP